ncbi:CAZyme family GH12 [Penicillium psychrosexuale]|uniref:CAZyme family GH12 n=1 Tax=Penicillium psychrosexuale TaxID=1002107 RepID=UPI0025455D17|nr:CAZyme family GH12 [Penicillium psychrosexuale]KAJ5791728.1 CAZyme family GH12 [Penicillium psychrosexuale]
MKSFIAPVSLLCLGLSTMGNAARAPVKAIARRADFCDQWGTTTTDTYILYNNLWNEAQDPSGTQCTGLDSSSGNKIAWHTSWSWAGATNQVKSYASASLQFTPKTLSAISSIESVWDWSYSTTDIVADVAYDMFLSSTADGSEEYEIMVWLAALGGAGPISSTGKAIATVTINGVEWDVWVGPNGQMTVYSFVAKSTVTSFSGDLLKFFTYLVNDQGLSDSKYLIDVQAGTEPFTGTAKLTVSSYSVAVV